MQYLHGVCEKRLLVNAFFFARCNYCQLVSMYFYRINNNKVNRLHEKCLCLIYWQKLFFEDLLEKGGPACIDQKNLRAQKLFKIFIGLRQVIFAGAFSERQQSQYNMRN